MPKMPRRRFGRTELDMPVFSTGGMRYQHSWEDVDPAEIPAANQANLEATIRRSVELGINHIETARGYGTSEIQLGQVLPSFPRDELIVQTKVGPTETVKEFNATFNLSMRNLKLDHVELLSLHGINDRQTLDWSLGHCIEAAHKLRRVGRARFIGFSTHAPTPIIIEAINSGAFDYINVHWYWVNDFNWPAILMARQQDMGIFIISPNDKGGMLYKPTPQLKRLCAPLSPMQFNDMYCLSRDEVHTLSLGAAKPSDYDDHIEGLKHYKQRAKISAEISERLHAQMRKKLGADWYANWAVGLPEYWDVPGGVNLKEIFRLYNYASALGMTEWAAMRYNLLGNAGHWFPGQNAKKLRKRGWEKCLEKSPFSMTDILDTLREAEDLLGGIEVKRLSES